MIDMTAFTELSFEDRCSQFAPAGWHDKIGEATAGRCDP